MAGDLGTILLLEHNAKDLERVAEILAGRSYQLSATQDPQDALQRLKEERFDLFLCDPGTGSGGLIQWLAAVQSLPDPPELVFCPRRCAAAAEFVAKRAGAFEVLLKPLDSAALQRILRAALAARRRRRRDREQLPAGDGDGDGTLDQMVARDVAMRRAFELARQVAPTRATLMLSGESGTGKTMMARAIHRLSDRRDRPFVVVSCGALPETLLESELFGHVKGAFTGADRDKIGRFEEAHRGTLFLDEIDSASAALQLKLLRFLQDREFERVGESRTRTADVRLVLATNADLERSLEEGKFRRDLYYRVNVVPIKIPALRDRQADIVPLARSLLARAARVHHRAIPRVSRAAARQLLSYHWPGNVRELENALERALLFCDGTIQPEHLPDHVNFSAADPAASGVPPRLDPRRSYSLKTLLAGPERRILLAALETCAGNREQTARLLGINRATLFAKLRRHGLTRGRDR